MRRIQTGRKGKSLKNVTERVLIPRNRALSSRLGSSSGTAEDAPQWTERTLTPEEILTLTTAPVEIIPAPGVGKVLVPIAGSLYFSPGEVPYDGSGLGIGLGYGYAWHPSTEEQTFISFWDAEHLRRSGLEPEDWLKATEPMIGLIDILSTSGWTYFLESELDNAAITLGSTSPWDPIDGDGTLTVSLLYSILALAD